MDRLIVKGLGTLDGSYEFDFADMLGIGTPGSLTNREGHRVKTMSGVRAGELEDALIAGDNDVLVAFAAVILARHGKTVDEDKLWDSPMGSGVAFEFGEREQEVDPPVPAVTPDETPSASGGESGNSTSDQQANVRSLTGVPGSGMSAISVQASSATRPQPSCTRRSSTPTRTTNDC